MIAGDLNMETCPRNKLAVFFSVSFIYPHKTFLCPSNPSLKTTDLKDLVTVLKENLRCLP